MARNSSWKSWSSARGLEILQLVEIARPLIADSVGDGRREPRIAGEEPAARRDAVGDGHEFLGPQLGEVLDDAGLQELGVELGDAVDVVASDDRQIGHPQPSFAVLLEDRHPLQALGPAGESAPHRVHESAVDLVDDLQVAGDEGLHQRNRPRFQGLRQQGVVGVGAGGAGESPMPGSSAARPRRGDSA